MSKSLLPGAAFLLLFVPCATARAETGTAMCQAQEPAWTAAAGGRCTPASPCVCSSSEACELSCTADPKKPDVGCDFGCRGDGPCTFHCAGGHCTATASGPAGSELSCPGGSCTMTCAGDGGCEILDCRGGGCVMKCKSGSGCACEGPGCVCQGENCED